MYQKECKWCNEIITVEKQINFASHVASCKMNPNYAKRIEKLKSTKGILKKERITQIKECLKCGNKFEVTPRATDVKRNKVKSHCSRSCANSRPMTEEKRLKISNSMKISEKKYIPEKGRYVNEFVCLKCGKPGFDKRYKKNRKYHLECWLSISGGIKIGSSRSKKGWYKGYWCDSSYELAYLIYNLDHGIKIERNVTGFDYTFDSKQHLYYPDFIVNGKYIEIKNFRSKLTDAKLSFFPYDIEIYYSDTIEPFLNYVKSKYGNNFINLYEEKKESK